MHISQLINKAHHELTAEIVNVQDLVSTNVLVKKFLAVDYDLDLDYFDEIQTVKVIGVINFRLLVVDARDGQEFEYADGIDWNDEYTFNDELNDQANLILGDEFNLQDYIVEQININIPVNLSKNNDIILKAGSGWELLTQQQFDESENDNPDPRWEKLSEFKKIKK
ncbi:YceD family protein [Mesoplasma seiffertii]|uniref:YceD family protein n=1 Tax=Mesoplasma seiffertii TaxID=28224 RepID=UPI00047B13DF|nr:YceD family protein [Mesoplasma seiffertii]